MNVNRKIYRDIDPQNPDYLSLLDCLLEGDPAIRWQALRDLAGAEAGTAGRERSMVAQKEWRAAS